MIVSDDKFIDSKWSLRVKLGNQYMTSLSLAQVALLSGLDITNMEILLGPILGDL